MKQNQKELKPEIEKIIHMAENSFKKPQPFLQEKILKTHLRYQSLPKFKIYQKAETDSKGFVELPDEFLKKSIVYSDQRWQVLQTKDNENNPKRVIIIPNGSYRELLKKMFPESLDFVLNFDQKKNLYIEQPEYNLLKIPFKNKEFMFYSNNNFYIDLVF